jgi:hypothetical protein
MLLGEVEHPFADSALGLQNKLLANRRPHIDRVREYFLASPSPVNVRMIEEVCAFLHGRPNESFGSGLVQRFHPHAPYGDDRHL